MEATTLQPSKKDLDELLKSLSLSFPGEEEDGSSDDGDDVFGLAETADAQLRRLKKEQARSRAAAAEREGKRNFIRDIVDTVGDAAAVAQATAEEATGQSDVLRGRFESSVMSFDVFDMFGIGGALSSTLEIIVDPFNSLGVAFTEDLVVTRVSTEGQCSKGRGLAKGARIRGLGGVAVNNMQDFKNALVTLRRERKNARDKHVFLTYQPAPEVRRSEETTSRVSLKGLANEAVVNEDDRRDNGEPKKVSLADGMATSMMHPRELGGHRVEQAQRPGGHGGGGDLDLDDQDDKALARPRSVDEAILEGVLGGAGSVVSGASSLMTGANSVFFGGDILRGRVIEADGRNDPEVSLVPSPFHSARSTITMTSPRNQPDPSALARSAAVDQDQMPHSTRL